MLRKPKTKGRGRPKVAETTTLFQLRIESKKIHKLRIWAATNGYRSVAAAIRALIDEAIGE